MLTIRLLALLLAVLPAATFAGMPTCSCVAKWLPIYLRLLQAFGIGVRVTQLTGRYAASGGTHSGGGAIDVIIFATGRRTRAAAYRLLVKLARLSGADATWHRPKGWEGGGRGIEHAHIVLRACKHNGPARYQIAAVDAGFNGLGRGGRGGKDNGYRPLSKRSWSKGITWMQAQLKPKARPAWATLRPKTRPPVPWGTAVFLNLGDYNDFGARTASWRHPALAKAIADQRPDAAGVVELDRANRDRFHLLLNDHGYKLIKTGTDGRYGILPLGVPVRASGVFDLQPRYKGDDKQAAWFVADFGGTEAFVAVGHAENQDKSGDTQVGQVRSLIDQAVNKAASMGIGRDRVIVMADTNHVRTRAEAFNARGFVDTVDTAWRALRAKIATFTGWVASFSGRTGARIDIVGVDKSRPVIETTVEQVRTKHDGKTRNAADHLLLRVTLGRKK